MQRIAILGLGVVGSTLAMHLLAERQHRYQLVVMDPDANVVGAFLDLAHAATLNQHRIVWNDTQALRKCEVVFHTAGAKVPSGGNRRGVLEDSLRITHDLFSPSTFQNDPWIIVLSNPVDVISRACQAFTGCAPNKVIGTGTLLDSMRWQYYLCQQFQLPISEVQACILGEHGSSMVPVYSLSTKKGQALRKDEATNTAFEQTLKAAATIKSTAGATRFGVVQCALYIFHCLQQPTGQCTLASVPLNAPYALRLGQEDLYMSLPVRMMPEHGPVVRWENLHEDEWLAMQHSALELAAMGHLIQN